MKSKIGLIKLVAVIFAVAIPAMHASAQTGTPYVTLTGNLTSFLTVSTGNPTLTTNLTNGSTVTAGSVPISTTWLLPNTNATVKLYGYFSTTTALKDTPSGATIPTSDIFGAVTSTGGSASAPTTASTAFTQSGPYGVAGSSLLLDTYTLSATNFANIGGVTDTLTLSIATPAGQSAGTYTGTVYIQAQAN